MVIKNVSFPTSSTFWRGVMKSTTIRKMPINDTTVKPARAEGRSHGRTTTPDAVVVVVVVILVVVMDVWAPMESAKVTEGPSGRVAEFFRMGAAGVDAISSKSSKLWQIRPFSVIRYYDSDQN